MTQAASFKLTYSTMFDFPEELNRRYSEALIKVKANFGKEYPMIIDGKERFTSEKHKATSPINTEWHLATFQKGNALDAADAIQAARRAFPAWSHMHWDERVYLMRKVADMIDQRIYEIGCVMSLEVGKSRMEALGDAAETADLIRYACDQMEANHGYVRQMGTDPVKGLESTNQSILRPYGVWLVISPFNYPAALTGGPSGAALVAGNTLVIKPATNTSWTPFLLMECMQKAGIPDGVVNFVTGPGSSLGKALIESPEIDGLTFTGSYDVGMNIHRTFAQGRYIRPAILEMGGKNPAIISRHANLDDAALGAVRSAFGLQGQKCSACSRVFVERPVYDAILDRMTAITDKLVIGNPTEEGVYMGPVIDKGSYHDYEQFTNELRQAGEVLTGGKMLTEGELGKGYYCAPTIVSDVPLAHPLWKREMFVPILLVAPVDDLHEAMRLANDVDYGLTAGFYGTESEVDWFYDHIQAGVTYANRPQGATTGAWPGFQPFGGMKGSGSTGKNSGGLYYLPLYMHEQIRNHVRRI